MGLLLSKSLAARFGTPGELGISRKVSMAEESCTTDMMTGGS